MSCFLRRNSFRFVSARDLSGNNIANISSALFKNESTAQNLLVMSHFLIDEKYQKYRIAKVKDYISLFQTIDKENES